MNVCEPASPETPVREEPDVPRMTVGNGVHEAGTTNAYLTVWNGEPAKIGAMASNFYLATLEAERLCGMWFANCPDESWPKAGEKGADAIVEQAVAFYPVQPSHRVFCRKPSGRLVRYLVVLLHGARAVMKLDLFDVEPAVLFDRSPAGVWTPRYTHSLAFEGMAVEHVEVLAPMPRVGPRPSLLDAPR